MSVQRQDPHPAAAYEDEIDLRELFLRLWARKWLIVLCTVLSACGAVAYALQATEIFRAEAVLSIRNDAEQGGLAAAAAQFGGLADLAGLSMPGSKDKAVAVATLKSRALIERFIAERDLVKVLIDKPDPKDPPTVWDAHELFTKQVFKVTEDKKSGLITVAVEWKDPQLAADWVADLVSRANARLREVAIAESERNLAYVEEQARKSTVVEIQQSLYRLAETEIKKLMLARGANEYAFKTVDPARVPERRVRPKRAIIAVIGTLFGGFVGVFLVLVLPDRRKTVGAVGFP